MQIWIHNTGSRIRTLYLARDGGLFLSKEDHSVLLGGWLLLRHFSGVCKPEIDQKTCRPRDTYWLCTAIKE
jgi:hypothetical protein